MSKASKSYLFFHPRVLVFCQLNEPPDLSLVMEWQDRRNVHCFNITSYLPRRKRSYYLCSILHSLFGKLCFQWQGVPIWIDCCIVTFRKSSNNCSNKVSSSSFWCCSHWCFTISQTSPHSELTRCNPDSNISAVSLEEEQNVSKGNSIYWVSVKWKKCSIILQRKTSRAQNLLLI